MKNRLEIGPGALDFLASTPEAKVLLDRADRYLEAIGYTEHGVRHAKVVAKFARRILEALGKDPHTVELAAIAGYFHDVGNALGRQHHDLAGAFLVKDLLMQYEVPLEDRLIIMEAIANHENERLDVADEVTAAVVIGDKSDVHRTRVRNTEFITFDIHDRVNYAVTRSTVRVDIQKKEIILELEIDTSISSVTEYFEIFLTRMLFSRKAARRLGCGFGILANGVRLA